MPEDDKGVIETVVSDLIGDKADGPGQATPAKEADSPGTDGGTQGTGDTKSQDDTAM